MGLQTLLERAYTTILPDWFNDIRNILIGTLVGRDINGAPASGKDLGSQTYPWGTLYAGSIVLDGEGLDISQLETQSHKIVSGRKRSTSNQPDFIRAAGSSTNFTILAASTELVLQIAGESATWSSDVATAGTVAPSSNNTATVNDSTAAGQAATRTWGEYGSGSPYYGITMSGAGSNITAKVGTWQAFKIGTEYFLAYVESTTSLSRAFRGFFLDSTGAPSKRATFSNGATITLMSLGWVFLDADGSTVDTTYNNPTCSYAAPSSPASGDYWYSLSESLWYRYNGTTFVAVSRTLVGLVVLDSTNCVASRSFDFYALVRDENTVEVERTSNTVCKSSGLFSRVNVMGERISFFASRAVWDTTSNLAASTERYNAAVTASVTEYLYIADTGETKISDWEPYWRADLLGWYHPHNTWRCVGVVGVNSSAQFLGATRVKPGPFVLPQSSGTASAAATTSTPVDVASVTITTTGRSVFVGLMATTGPSRIRAVKNTVTAVQAEFTMYRDSTLLAKTQLTLGGASGNLQILVPPGAIWHIDSPPPGTYVYKLQVAADTTESAEVAACKLVAYEIS